MGFEIMSHFLQILHFDILLPLMTPGDLNFARKMSEKMSEVLSNVLTECNRVLISASFYPSLSFFSSNMLSF